MAERARLLIECVGNCTEGSNPSRSDDYYVLSRFGLIGLSIFVQLIMFCFCNLLYFSSCVLLLFSCLRLRPQKSLEARKTKGLSFFSKPLVIVRPSKALFFTKFIPLTSC